MGWKPKGSDGRLGGLFRGAGLEPYWGSEEADTMDSHRLAWYAAQVSPEHGERLWRSLSERYFEGKRTQIRPIRLDNPALLLECAEEAGLDLEEARRVISSDAHATEVHDTFDAMLRAGISSIPVLIFEIDSVPDSRVVHHGSGSTREFSEVLQQLHATCCRL
eukprot:TRINITY_DN45485_c0_g1_i1.p1 TRINITY_DN45485_c0_g1~~TRINITY_DN45485_c0_g1_i1.p1  ORF type:complete len:163 (+),score=32.61 TRINITY_DN45485_c0_g1_i1:486-974(+)